MIRSRLAARPVIAGRYLGAWLVLLATLPLGLDAYRDNPRIGLFTWEPGSQMGINSRTYHYAAELARAGEPFYDAVPPGTFDWAVYLYPPVTVLGYYPLSVVDWSTAYAVMILLSVGASVGATILIVDYVEDFGTRLGWLDIVLIFAAFVLSTHAFGTIYYGNINLILAFLITLGFWALARNRDSLAGVALALPALYKVFPAIIGLWLLRTRRWRAVAVAAGTGIASLLAGALLFGFETTVYYFTDVLAGRGSSQQFVGGYPVDGTYYLTIQQPLSQWLYSVWPSAPYQALVALAVVVSAVTLAFFYRSVETPLDRLMAIFVTLVVMIVIFPALRWYLVMLYLPLVGLLYVWDGGPGRWAFVAGGVLMSFTGSTGDVVEILDRLPASLDPVWFSVGGFAMPPLYGLGLMVAACAWYKYRRPAESGLDHGW
ncbi:MAG: glycosyltransferase family 87 protein [Halovenus sp.]